MAGCLWCQAGHASASGCWLCSLEAGPKGCVLSLGISGGASGGKLWRSPSCMLSAWVAFFSKGLPSSWDTGKDWWRPRWKCHRLLSAAPK